MNISSFFSSNTNTSSANLTADVYAKVSKTMEAQNTLAPKLNAALSADKTTLSGLGQLQSALASFQGVAQSLGGSGLSLSASASAKEVLSATTSSRSAAVTYAIQVAQLAASQVLRSKSLTSPDAAIGSGTASRLSFDFGTTSGSTFTTNPTVKSGNAVAIPSGSNSLQGIAAAINGANIGVTAKVTTSGAGYALELTGPSGAANSMRIGVSGDPALQALLTQNPAGTKDLSQTAAAQDAKLTINGVAVSSPSNTLADAVSGTILSLAATGASTLVVAQGATQLGQNITNLVTAYNALNTKLSTLQQGDLKADGSAARAQGQLARIIAAGSNSTASSPTLAAIGITTQKDGSLSLDANKLQAAIAANPGGVAKIFTSGGKGVADNLASQIQAIVGPAGTLPQKEMAVNKDIASLNTQRDSLEKTLTAQANALVKLYSQQSQQGSFAGGTSSATGTSNGPSSLFDFLPF